MEIIRETSGSLIDVKTEKPANLTEEQIKLEIETIFKKINGRPTIGDGLWFG